jgi:hypothetical protein
VRLDYLGLHGQGVQGLMAAVSWKSLLLVMFLQVLLGHPELKQQRSQVGREAGESGRTSLRALFLPHQHLFPFF